MQLKGIERVGIKLKLGKSQIKKKTLILRVYLDDVLFTHYSCPFLEILDDRVSMFNVACL